MENSSSVLNYSIIILALFVCSSCVTAFSPPSLGLGAVFFRPAGMKTVPAQGNAASLKQAADFFTDAFWANKVGGGIKELQSKQRKSLLGSQTTEFRKRYGLGDRVSELLICRNGKEEVMGCCGIEVDNIFSNGLQSNVLKQAPLMSNLAVGRDFRRRGIAEDLVKEAELLARKRWGFDEVYLYVEKRNKAAVKLYRKLGYRPHWEDDSAKTLLPLKTGSMKQVSTTLLCMKKRIGLGLLGRILPY